MSRLPRLLPMALLAALALLIALPLAGQDKPKGKKYALLVGITEYDHSKLAPLKYTENDVEELARVLANKSGGFGSVRLLTTSRGEKRPADKPTAKNIRAAVKNLLAKKTRHDTLLVALSGHGLELKVKGKDEAFFCPCDAQVSDAASMIGLKALFDQLDDSGAGVKLLLVDACRNDPKLGRNVDVDNLPRPPRGTAALFSCASGQRAFETAKLGKGHGVFFYHVLKGLKGEAKNKRGEVTWDRLTEYVKEKVSDEVPVLIGEGAKQSPHKIENLVGKSPVLLQEDTRTGRVEGTKPDSESGWVRLFNGKDLTGWSVPRKGTGSWKVEKGLLIGSGPASHLFSRRGDYTNFHIRVEAMINATGNSGVFFRAPLDIGRFPKGYEAQIATKRGDRGGQLTGSLYGIVKVAEEHHRPDEWFTQEVIANGDRIVIKVNDKTVVDVRDGKYRTGHFALQQHHPGSVVKFRKIEVRELPER
jgi:hypothetical protein